MARSETVKIEIRRYPDEVTAFENDLVAQLPGLLITQFEVAATPSLLNNHGLALRFDFIDDWYSVIAYLDDDKKPTGHYSISIQTPLTHETGTWKGYDLLLNFEVQPNGEYVVDGEEAFCAAVEEGWMRVYAAANAREAMRKLCAMLDEGMLPQEVMDAVCG